MNTHKPLQSIQYYKSLNKPKGRKQYNRFTVEGPKTISDLLDSGYKFEELLIEKSKITALKKSYPKIFEYSGLKILDKNHFSKISDTVTSQGVIAVAVIPEPCTGFHNGVVLAFNGLQDSGNVGTIVRTAVAMGINQFVFDKGTSNPYSPKVIRSSAGTILSTKISTCQNLLQEIIELKSRGFKICSLEAGADKNIDELRGFKSQVLIIGGEGKGIDPEIRKESDINVCIKIKQVESLNAAVAAVIALYVLTSNPPSAS